MGENTEKLEKIANSLIEKLDTVTDSIEENDTEIDDVSDELSEEINDLEEELKNLSERIVILEHEDTVISKHEARKLSNLPNKDELDSELDSKVDKKIFYVLGYILSLTFTGLALLL